MKRIMACVLAIVVLLPAAVWGQVASSAAGTSAANDTLAGAWRAKVQFKTGMLADWKNLEFMYVFNHGPFYRPRPLLFVQTVSTSPFSSTLKSSRRMPGASMRTITLSASSNTSAAMKAQPVMRGNESCRVACARGTDGPAVLVGAGQKRVTAPLARALSSRQPSDSDSQA